ncbi:hypothetical protein LTR84_010415 [Exophiala bonariae]|uniref:Mid2 domain-containing protein n=1 Tax=Exophiala bonariae TaxID=1690606 RepID=A0AAV9MTF4_9EURO|nr:hypothetical protein LTR84_010415 [Exophiala bonariae]
MIALRNIYVLLSLLLVSFSEAQTVQDLWISPASPEFSTNLTVGETYELKWDSSLADQFATFAQTVDPSNTDLWITDYNLHVYSKRIAARQNLNSITTLSWKVDIAADDIAATNQWVFRWLEQGVDYADTTDQISSPGFYVQEDITAAVTRSSTIIGATYTSETPVTSSAISAASNASASEASAGSVASSNIGNGLSTGAKADIGIGAVLGAALLLGLGWFLARKAGKFKTGVTDTPNRTELPVSHSSAPPEAKFQPYSDLPSQSQLVPQYQQANFAELENTDSRSGPHELSGQDGYRQM